MLAKPMKIVIRRVILMNSRLNIKLHKPLLQASTAYDHWIWMLLRQGGYPFLILFLELEPVPLVPLVPL